MSPGWRSWIQRLSYFRCDRSWTRTSTRTQYLRFVVVNQAGLHQLLISTTQRHSYSLACSTGCSQSTEVCSMSTINSTINGTCKLFPNNEHFQRAKILEVLGFELDSRALWQWWYTYWIGFLVVVQHGGHQLWWYCGEHKDGFGGLCYVQWKHHGDDQATHYTE